MTALPAAPSELERAIAAQPGELERLLREPIPHDTIERLRQALRVVYGDDPSIDEIRSEDLLGEYPTVRYYPPSGDLFIDVMTRLGEVADYEGVEAEERVVEGIRVRVATPRALYRLKRNTVRPLDRQDAAALAARFGLEDED